MSSFWNCVFPSLSTLKSMSFSSCEMLLCFCVIPHTQTNKPQCQLRHTHRHTESALLDVVPITVTSSVSSAVAIFSRQVSTTEVSPSVGADDNQSRAVDCGVCCWRWWRKNAGEGVEDTGEDVQKLLTSPPWKKATRCAAESLPDWADRKVNDLTAVRSIVDCSRGRRKTTDFIVPIPMRGTRYIAKISQIIMF